ncbi:MAG: 4Fe-4S binding protein, partial [Acidiferrobacterales bacterium]
MTAQLNNTTPNGRARQAALSAKPVAKSPTSLISYQSAGYLLIIGSAEQATELAKELKSVLKCAILLTPPRKKVVKLSEWAHSAKTNRAHPASQEGIPWAQGKLEGLTGHLGQFTALLATSHGSTNLAEYVGIGREHFDIVLDLATPPYIEREIAPPGYYAPGDDADALSEALQALPTLVGEFEKPKYFAYNADICAHGGSGLIGCRRCLDACPTLAISSLGDSIEVDPYLCQGGGVCAAACPTGAITYVYPSTSDLLDGLRAMLKAYREAGGQHPCVMFHDREKSQALLERIAARLPEQVIPVEVEEAASVGLDTWLATLAYGASQVAVLSQGATPSVLDELNDQFTYATAILQGMGYPPERLRLIDTDDDGAVLESLARLPEPSNLQPAGFAGLDEKRTTIRLAVDHLHAHAPAPTAVAALPLGAPFGEIQVDRSGCTLCMACASICPHAALSDGGELPQLLFDEWNCVQCGLCETACPED